MQVKSLIGLAEILGQFVSEKKNPWWPSNMQERGMHCVYADVLWGDTVILVSLHISLE